MKKMKSFLWVVGSLLSIPFAYAANSGGNQVVYLMARDTSSSTTDAISVYVCSVDPSGAFKNCNQTTTPVSVLRNANANYGSMATFTDPSGKMYFYFNEPTSISFQYPVDTTNGALGVGTQIRKPSGNLITQAIFPLGDTGQIAYLSSYQGLLFQSQTKLQSCAYDPTQTGSPASIFSSCAQAFPYVSVDTVPFEIGGQPYVYLLTPGYVWSDGRGEDQGKANAGNVYTCSLQGSCASNPVNYSANTSVPGWPSAETPKSIVVMASPGSQGQNYAFAITCRMVAVQGPGKGTGNVQPCQTAKLYEYAVDSTGGLKQISSRNLTSGQQTPKFNMQIMSPDGLAINTTSNGTFLYYTVSSVWNFGLTREIYSCPITFPTGAPPVVGACSDISNISDSNGDRIPSNVLIDGLLFATLPSSP